MLIYLKSIRAKKLEQKQKWHEAAAIYRKLIDLSRKPKPDLLYRLGFVLIKQKKWQQAAPILLSACQHFPAKAQWWFRLAQCQEHLALWLEAAQHYLIAYTQQDSKTQWLENAARCLSKTTDREQVFTLINELHLPAEVSAQICAALGATSLAQKRWHQAELYYQKAISYNQNRADYKSQLAHSLRAQKKWWEEILALEDAIQLNKNEFTWFYRLAEALEQMRFYQKAAKYYGKAIDNNPSPAPALWHYQQGYCYERNGQDGEAQPNLAQDCYANAIASDERHEVQRLGIGVFHEGCNRFQLALNSYKEKLSLYSEDAEIWYRIGLCNDRLHNWAEAERYYKKALNIDFTLPSYHYGLGFVLEKQTKYGEAAAAYQNAIDRNNEPPLAWYSRWAAALEGAGKNQAALNALQLAHFISEPQEQSEQERLSKAHLKQRVIYTEFYERLPLQEHMVLYESFHGKSMSCNPYALFLWLWQHDVESKYLHIWVINDNATINPSFKSSKNIIFVQRDSTLYKRYINEAKYLINNNTFAPYFIRKEGQIYLNTWHGTPLKTLGKDIKTGFFEHQNVSRNFLQATHILSPNPHTTQVLLAQHDVYSLCSDRLLEMGYPRIDLTLDQQLATQIRAQLQIEKDKKVVFYAPTYRGSTQGGKGTIEFEALNFLLSRLEAEPGIQVFFRGHHMIEAALKKMNISANYLPDSIDTNAFLSVVDILITDYSSVLFDFLVHQKPILLYTYDYESYIEQRGLYLEKSQLPGLVCPTVDAVIEQLRNSINHWTPRSLLQAKADYCPYEDGMVSQRVWHTLFSSHTLTASTQPPKQRLLIYAGALMLNGITVSLKNLLSQLDLNKYDVYLTIEPSSFKRDDQFEQLDAVRPYAHILPRFGQMNWTYEEHWLMEQFNAWHHLPNESMQHSLQRAYEREAKRLYGLTHFDVVINFEGYVRYWAQLFAYHPHNLIYLHNDMYSEWLTRFPNQESVFNLYQHYKKLVSVSASTNTQNKHNLAQRYQLDLDRFTYVNNLLDPASVLANASCPINDETEQQFIATASPLFVNIARLSVEKGQEQLLYAFAEVVKQHPSAKLLIVGAGPLWETLHTLINTLRLERNVVLTGLKSNPFPYLQAADCFVFSSKHEGQGLVLLEARILNKPIICSDFPCAHDVLENEQHGVIVENSVRGLQRGLLRFIEKQEPYPPTLFNVESYQTQALKQFENMLYQLKHDH